MIPFNGYYVSDFKEKRENENIMKKKQDILLNGNGVFLIE